MALTDAFAAPPTDSNDPRPRLSAANTESARVQLSPVAPPYSSAYQSDSFVRFDARSAAVVVAAGEYATAAE